MAKIERFNGNVKAFAADAVNSGDYLERSVFGSTATGDTLDENMVADFFRGFGVVGPNGVPPKAWFNAALYTISQMVAYLHQAGVPEWNADQEYHTGSITNKDGVLYVSLEDDNKGNDPASDAENWKALNKAESVTYDGTASGLDADNTQDAIDEMVGSKTNGAARRAIFYDSGVFISPAGVDKLYITAVSGGGGGGGGILIGNGGGGGAGAGIIKSQWKNEGPGAGVTITVGKGGAPGADGGDTVIASDIKTVTLKGGKAGSDAGAGGLGGEHPWWPAWAGLAGSANAGSDGGAGGASLFSPGGTGAKAGDIARPGEAGSGGGGGSATHTKAPGGGGDGFVLIEW